jgi:hypothetical protein
MTILDEAIRAACTTDSRNASCDWPSKGCDQNCEHFPEAIKVAVAVLLPAKPTAEVIAAIRTETDFVNFSEALNTERATFAYAGLRRGLGLDAGEPG